MTKSFIDKECRSPNKSLGWCKYPSLCTRQACGPALRVGKKDQTGTHDRPNLIRDALQEFPYAQYAIAALVKDAAKSKHPVRSWRDRAYAGGTYKEHLAYFTGKAGRHIARTEIDGEVNKAESNQLHMIAAAWALMGYVEIMLREAADKSGIQDPSDLLKAIKEGKVEL